MNPSKIVIYIGKYFQQEEFGNWQDISNFMNEDPDNGGHRLPKEEISLWLEILSMADFLDKFENGLFTWRRKIVIKQEVIKQVMPFLAESTPLYGGEI